MTSNTITPEQRKRLNQTWRQYLRKGFAPSETRDLITTDSNGTAVIPQGFDSNFTDALKFYGPIATLVKRRDSDSGAPQKFAITDDTASTMSYVAETGPVLPLEADPVLRSTITGTATIASLVRYSWQELSDAFDLQSFLTNIAGLRVARAVEYALTLGKDNGTNTALPNSPAGGLLAGVSAGVTGSTIANTLTYANLAALAGSVDHAYYVNGGYMASPSVFSYLLEQTDSTGRALYPIGDDGLMRIAGKPLYVNAAMPAYSAASSPVVLFGDLSRQYAYLNGGGVRIKVLGERWAETQESGMIVYHRLGASNLLNNAVKSLVTAAS